MGLIEKFKSFIDDIKKACTTNNNMDDYTLVHKKEITERYQRFNRLNECNKILNDENKKLKETIAELQNKIDDLNKKLDQMETSGGIFTTITTYDLPKQEPIRSNKPKKNRNNKHRRYKSSSNKEIKLINDKDIPKPGSGDKVEFKNGNPIIKRKRNFENKEN
ncbi:MAG: hypothetical protein IJ193_07945 [Bacilli bacterium]|nr:hypothetical protein [Bacilli bacterium]